MLNTPYKTLLRNHPATLLLAVAVLLSGCGGGSSNSGNGTILTAVDDGPISTTEGATLSVTQGNGVLNNDTTTGSDPLTAVLVSGPANASAFTLNADGSFTYTHDASETTSDSFTYRAEDGAESSNIATATIAITPVNDPPVAADDSYSGVNEGGTLNRNAVIGVLGNDTDAENDALSAVLVSGPSSASAFTLNADGSFSYTHDGSETTSDSFTYQANDGTAPSNTATVTITITPVNDPPVAVDDSYSGVAEGGTLTVDTTSGLLSNDLDAENDTLSATLVTGPAYASAFTLNGDGSFSYTHDGSETTSDSFTYKVNDGSSDSNTATVTLTITPVNDAPVATDDSGLANENTPLIIDVVSNDSDVDGSIDNTSLVVTTQPANGTATANADGTITYTPDAGFLGPNTDSFQYTVDDNGGATSNVATVAITLNAPPVPVAGCATTPETSPLNGTLTATDAESPSNMLTYSLVSDGTKGTVNLNADGTYTYTPNNNGQRGTDTFTYRVDDPDGGFSTATETVIIDQKIMFLGDSITRGTTSSGVPADPLKVGYRKPIYDSLVANGYSFDFVGSDSLTGNDPSLQPFDPDNEGHGGWTDQDLAWGQTGYPVDGIRAWLDMNPADIILLHAGTNGFHVEPNHIQEILDEIDVWENSPNGNPVTVVLARMIDNNPSNPDVTTFNDNVVAMAQARISDSNDPAYPDDIIIVDQQSALWDASNQPDPNLYGDSLHPNSSGYSLMADVWLYPLSGTGTQTGTGTADQTGAYTGTGLLEKCP